MADRPSIPQRVLTAFTLAITLATIALAFGHLSALGQSFELDPEIVAEVQAEPCVGVDDAFVRGLVSTTTSDSASSDDVYFRLLAFAECANYFRSQGDNQRALAHLNLAIDGAQPPLALALALRAEIWRALGHYTSAIEDYRLSQRISFASSQRGDANAVGSPEYIDIHIGDALVEAGDIEEAIASYDLYIVAYAGSSVFRPEALLKRGLAYHLHDEIDAAIRDYDRLLETPALPDLEALAYVYRGLAHADAGRYEDAVLDLDEAIAIDPELSTPHFHRAYVHCLQGDVEPAVADLLVVFDLIGDAQRAQLLELVGEQDVFEESLANLSSDDLAASFRTLVSNDCGFVWDR